jgi:hypothetical protein
MMIANHNPSTCYWCQRLTKILGVETNHTEGTTMSKIELTDAQTARLFKLCEEILSVRNEMPRAPFRSGEVDLEVAKALRSSLDLHQDALIELGALLR